MVGRFLYFCYVTIIGRLLSPIGYIVPNFLLHIVSCFNLSVWLLLVCIGVIVMCLGSWGVALKCIEIGVCFPVFYITAVLCEPIPKIMSHILDVPFRACYDIDEVFTCTLSTTY